MQRPLSFTLTTCLFLTTACLAQESATPAQSSPAATPTPDASATPRAAASSPGTIRISSGVAEKNLIKSVPPIYPNIAKATHTTGTVVLDAVISTEGDVVKLTVISGPPLLRQAAIDAVRQWKYKPVILNGAPVVVLTKININFS